MLVNSKIVSFNILANRFTYYSTQNHKTESESLMRFRYKSIIDLLWGVQGDIYFLQEVDQHFYHLLRFSRFKNKFYISFALCQPRNDEPNKDEIGLIIMVNRRQYYINKSFNSKINTPEDKKNFPLLKTRGEPSSFIGFNELVVRDGQEIGNIKKLSQLLVIEKNHHSFILINCHFEGRPDRQDLRIEQFKKCCHVAQDCITKYDLDNRILIGGDFNEPKEKDISKLYLPIIPFNFKLLNTKSDYTSNLRYQKNKETKKWESINRTEKLDYLLGNDFFKVTKETLLPNVDIHNFPDWGKRFDTKIFTNLPKVTNWPSDHRLVSLLLEYNTDNCKSIKKTQASTRKKTFKKNSSSQYQLL